MDYRSRYVHSEQFLAIDNRTGTNEATRRSAALTYAVIRDIDRQIPRRRHRSVVWTQGDRIDYLAHVHLGSAHLWYRIMDMNPHVSDPNAIEPGTLLRIPRMGV